MTSRRLLLASTPMHRTGQPLFDPGAAATTPGALWLIAEADRVAAHHALLTHGTDEPRWQLVRS